MHPKVAALVDVKPQRRHRWHASENYHRDSTSTDDRTPVTEANSSCAECDAVISPRAKYCSECGAHQFAKTSIDQSKNHQGINIAGNTGRDFHITQQFSASPDDRVTMPHERAEIRRILPPDVLSIIAGFISVGGLVLSPNLPHAFAIMMAPLALISGILALAGFIAAQSLRGRGYHVLPFDLGLLEKDRNGRPWITRPTSICQFCPPERATPMTVGGTTDRPIWTCPANADHNVGFDNTQMPILEV